MYFRKQSILCVIISSLIMASTLLSFGYCVARSETSKETPYGLTYNYTQLKLIGTSKVNFQDIVNINTDTNITIISEYSGQNYIALYDPNYYFYNQKMVDFIGTTRYFSHSDYVNKTRTGILVSDDSNIFKGYSDLANHTTPLLDELIFSVNPLSSLYTPSIDYIINQTSIDYLGDIIYIDSTNPYVIKDLKEKLLLAGYTVVPNSKHNFLTVCAFVLTNGLYEKVILIPALTLYFIFIFTCLMYFLNHQYILNIHRLHGGNLIRTFFYLSKKFILLNSLFSLITMLLCIVFLQNDFLMYYDLTDYIQIYALHISFTSLSYYLGFYVNYNKRGLFYDK